ncbi:hypothetical protein VNO77_12831 [Canavalia gladiata]|uniref:Uncharacterized protein n=1 Tax=Canavalia gladiata TaxID=3824 RepID=A0AAN9LXT3_CANGL
MSHWVHFIASFKVTWRMKVAKNVLATILLEMLVDHVGVFFELSLMGFEHWLLLKQLHSLETASKLLYHRVR